MMERLLAKTDACLEKTAAHQERMEVNMNAWQEGNKACPQETGVCLMRKEQTPVKMAKRVAHTEIPKKEAAMEIIGSLVDQYGDHDLDKWLTAEEMDPGRQ
jgi:hypothetical protein